jgi:hypothetical protein
MTAYEYLDLANGALANNISLLTFGFTIISAYLLVAYFIGSKLTTVQVVAITVVYTIAFSMNLIGQIDAFIDAIEYKRLAKEISADVELRIRPRAQYFVLAIRSLVYVISLWFMWSVRHPKTE